MEFDLVIRGGDVVDGTGAPRYRADVALIGPRIAEVGRIDGRGNQEIDAEGHIVCPGFVDGHTHFDAQVNWDPLGTNSCWHGVTTAVMGNCGFTLAPVSPDGHGYVTRNLERAEDIAAESLAAGIDWKWEEFPQYLDVLDSLPKGINYASNVGHSALRTWAMGPRAFEESASEEDLRVMEHQLREALQAGAIGFTTSRSIHHETADGHPVASRLATWHELQRLVGVLGDLGAGLFELALEAESRSPETEPRAESNGRLRDLAVESRVPTTFGVVPNNSEGDAWRAQLQMIEEVVERGGRMFGQTHSRGVSTILTFQAHTPFDRFPIWHEVRRRPLQEQAVIYRDSDRRRALVDSAHQHDPGRAIGAEPRAANFDAMYILDSPLGPHRTVGEEAGRRGIDPVELILDLALESDFEQQFMQAVTVTDEATLLEVMRHPHTVMTFSDSGAHVSQIADSSIHTYLLAHWVRAEQAIPLEEAIRMITSVPATAWGFADRGTIRPGAIADLNVLDPQTVAPCLPRVEADLPGGARRFVQHATGIHATVVAGAVTIVDGIHTGSLPGALIRGPLAPDGRITAREA